MNIGVILPGFSSHEDDWAIPVQLNLVRELALEDDVRVLALRYPHRRDRYWIQGAEVTSLGVGQVTRARRLVLWQEALRTLRRLHREKPFDILHAMWADETGLVATWVGKWLTIPTVVSIAGGELVGFADLGYGLQLGRFSRWTVGQALMADRVITACAYARGLIRSAGYRIDESRLHTITLGVDPQIFCPDGSAFDPRKLIHVASLIGIKDQAMLLRALARLGPEITLEIVGTGPERSRLEALAAQLGVRERVHFAGDVHHLDLPQHYRRAALNILPSRHEGLGMVTLEAAACGVPTVGTTVGLLPDEPSLGAAVPVGEDEALAQAIYDLLTNPQRLLALRQSAHETALARYTIQHTAARLRILYEEIAR